MSVIDPLRLEVQSCEVSYTLQVNLHLFFMTLLTAFRQLYVTDITLNEAILLEVQFRVFESFGEEEPPNFQFCQPDQRGEFSCLS
ncbi:hypothetical protein HUN01_07845 [Nostoc edaphicum CCNP1411]|uniref:Uncharacterized protein n=1 Tax=Nostoc edaphicum CCNP1411 TaxID=1472755 RepID=A0A7D7Q9F0_9NOSO|nr:hypothetical protein [Nostoc edaphicum]QMS87497.1 hypothetical protein HUN01_07845 [Nostoc edaphicum CCNP1411]